MIWTSRYTLKFQKTNFGELHHIIKEENVGGCLCLVNHPAVIIMYLPNNIRFRIFSFPSQFF